MKIRYITPFSTESNKFGFPNIGGEYNQVISELPDDCYVVLRDGDTMFLTSDWGEQIKDIIEANSDYDLITCMTNRLGINDQVLDYMFDCDSITDHKQTAWVKTMSSRLEVEPSNLAAGLCMIFHKSLWIKAGGFPEYDVTFDRIFSDKVIKSGGKIGIAKGLYLLHLYRWGKLNPKSYIDHLMK